MHSHAIPPGEGVTMTQLQMTLNGKLICKPPAFTKEGLLKYIMELIVMEDEEPATAQQSLLLVAYPTAWQTIPTLECLASVWGMMAGNPEYAIIVDAITKGLKNVEKYYQKASDLDIYFICLVLDSNYKLAYVKQ
ncbi:hypothetical protein BDR04DRAFT_1163139 [Suillus decipiens]|nr:hypothetical protein BDR04DRAFT_1163139 [Suillus decipiens]